MHISTREEREREREREREEREREEREREERERGERQRREREERERERARREREERESKNARKKTTIISFYLYILDLLQPNNKHIYFLSAVMSSRTAKCDLTTTPSVCDDFPTMADCTKHCQGESYGDQIVKLAFSLAVM